jgi:hypothetical protein
MKEWKEAEIIINGHLLTFAESMTVRVAIETLSQDLMNGLGNDDVGNEICKGYYVNIDKIRTYIHKSK